MKHFMIFVFSVAFFSSCSNAPQYLYDSSVSYNENPIIIPRAIKVEYFSIKGALRVDAFLPQMQRGKSIDSTLQMFEQDEFCKTEYSISGRNEILNLGERFFRQGDSLVLQCIYYAPYLSTTTPAVNLRSILRNIFMRRTEVFDEDSAYRVIYWGDSLGLKSDQVYNHQVTTQILKFHTEYNYRDTIYETRQVHEFYLRKSDPVYSISFRTNPEKLKGYKPLKIDPSLLPLESPKYKALKASEEKLRK